MPALTINIINNNTATKRILESRNKPSGIHARQRKKETATTIERMFIYSIIKNYLYVFINSKLKRTEKGVEA